MYDGTYINPKTKVPKSLLDKIDSIVLGKTKSRRIVAVDEGSIRSGYQLEQRKNKLYKLYKTAVPELIKKQKYWAAIDTIDYIFQLIQMIEVMATFALGGFSENEDFHFEMHNLTTQYLGRIHRKMPKTDEVKLYNYLEKIVKPLPAIPTPYHFAINTFLNHDFKDEKLLARSYERTEQMIEDLAENDPDHIAMPESLILDIIDLMDIQGASEADIYEYCLKYWNLPSVRNAYLQRCLQDERYDELITLAQDLLNNPDAIPMEEIGAHRYLAEAYAGLGKKKQQISELTWLLEEYPAAFFPETYYDLRNCYSPEEWQKKRKRYLDCLKKLNDGRSGYLELDIAEHLWRIFYEEGQYDTMFEILDHYYWAIDDCIIDGFEKENLKYALAAIEHNINQYILATDRNSYQRIIRYLQRLQKIKGGKQLAKDLIADWREEYPNRKLFWQMMAEAGF